MGLFWRWNDAEVCPIVLSSLHMRDMSLFVVSFWYSLYSVVNEMMNIHWKCTIKRKYWYRLVFVYFLEIFAAQQYNICLAHLHFKQ